MLRKVLEKLAGWIRTEWEAASYNAATQGVTDGINAALRDITAGSVTAEITIKGNTLSLSEAVTTDAKPSIATDEIDGLRRKADAIALADQHGITLDESTTLASMKDELHAATC